MNRIVIRSFGLLLIAAVGGSATAQESALRQDGIVYHVDAKPSYPDPEAVDVSFVIENTSDKAMVVVLNRLHRITLRDPDGKPVRPYPYRPSGAGARMYAIEAFPPGGRCAMELRLSALFPFPVPGVYRGTFVQRVYQWNSADMPDTGALIDNDYYGVPVDVTAKEISFRVERATDPSRKSPTVDPQNGIDEPGIEYNAIDATKYPLRGEGHFKISKPPADHQTNPHGRSLAPLGSSDSIDGKPFGWTQLPTSPPWAIVLVFIAGVGLVWFFLNRRS